LQQREWNFFAQLCTETSIASAIEAALSIIARALVSPKSSTSSCGPLERNI